MNFVEVLTQISNKKKLVGLGLGILALLVLTLLAGVFLGMQLNGNTPKAKTPEVLSEGDNPTPTFFISNPGTYSNTSSPTLTSIPQPVAKTQVKSVTEKVIITITSIPPTLTPVLPTSTPIPPTNTPIPSTPTQASSFWPSEPERHSTYPIIIKVSDNSGNFTTGSSGNGIPFFVTWPDPKPTIKIGQTVVITIEAEDPNGDPLQYQFKNNLNQTVQDWSSNNKLSWIIGQETGGSPFIVPAIKDNDGVSKYGDSDDSTSLFYQLGS